MMSIVCYKTHNTAATVQLYRPKTKREYLNCIIICLILRIRILELNASSKNHIISVRFYPFNRLIASMNFRICLCCPENSHFSQVTLQTPLFLWNICLWPCVVMGHIGQTTDCTYCLNWTFSFYYFLLTCMHLRILNSKYVPRLI